MTNVADLVFAGAMPPMDGLVLAQGIGSAFQQTAASGPLLLALGACLLVSRVVSS